MDTGSLKKSAVRWAGFVYIAAICFVAVCHSPVAAQSVVVTEDQAIADKFVRHTVTGITTPLPVLPDVTGFIGASYLTIADLDADGIKEIVATSGVGPDSSLATANGEVALFTWDGINKGSWTQTVLNNTFVFPNEGIVRDMNDDGNPDIVVFDKFIGSRGFWGGVYYLENQGGEIANQANWLKRTIYLDNRGSSTTPTGQRSYHRGYFIDLDGDGDDDIITMNFNMLFTPEIIFLENTGTLPYTLHTIGSGGGSLFAMFDVNGDGYLDIIAPQSNNITATLEVKGGPDGSDPLGDSVAWFKNPGPTAIAANRDLAWSRYTINNYWKNPSNPIGRGYEVVIADIDGDDISELVVSNHNHQSDYGTGNQIWPSGVYYFEIPGLGGNPGNPEDTAAWNPITIETGNVDFEYSNVALYDYSNSYLDPNVWADLYAVDRRSAGAGDQGSPGMVRAGDVNGDGRVDLVVPGDGKGRVYYYEADEPSGGSLTFNRASLYTDLQSMPGDAQIVDLDDDGDLDIVAAIFDTSVNHPSTYTSSSIFFFEQINDDPPALTAGPYLAAGTWTILPTSAESPMYLDANYDVVWKFSDDFASCSGTRVHARCRVPGAGRQFMDSTSRYG